MACVALASLISTIQLEFLQPFPRVPLLHQPPIQSFFESICSLQAFLQESSGGAAAIKDLEIQIRDFALKAEDDIEIQLSNFVLAKGREDQEKASYELDQALQEAAENASDLLNIINNEADDDEDNEKHQPSIHSLKHASCRSENEKWDGSSRRFPKFVGRMVGRHHDREVIIKWLRSGPSYLMLIPIVGMVGIGKTTLAKSVYGDPQVVNSFNVCRWITVPQECNKRQILGLLLRSISPPPENKIGREGATDEELVVEVRRHLSGKRYLIVFDNIQDHRVLKYLRLCFPGNYGSRILLTTTYFNWKKYIKRYNCTDIHNMTLLDSHECWNLFCSVFFRNKKCMTHKLEKIRSDIVETCDGLPWSIVVVAKRLSKCSNILKGWEKIKKETETLGILDHNALNHNYNQLSQHLKVCFLYFGVFPKRKEVLVKMVIRLWIGEGFVDLEPLVYPELENQAYAYLEELIVRSLVLVCSEDYDGKTKSCRMHSALHSFCVGEAQKEGIFCGVNTLKHSRLPLGEFANSCRWLSLCTHSFDYYVLLRTNNCSSIFFFHENPESFVLPKFLRILAFVPSPFLQRRENLVFLRYVHVKQWFEGLEDIVPINPNLQVLIVSHKEGMGRSSFQNGMLRRLPSKIWETQSQIIRHVEVSYSLSVDPPPPGMVKESLQTLYWLSLEHCTKEVFSRIPNVNKLGIICGWVEECAHNNLQNLQYLGKLEKLMIAFRKGSPSGFRNLKTLPKELKIKKLKLKRTCLPWSEINEIGCMLPHLEVLKLKEASNGSKWEDCTDFGKSWKTLKSLFLEAKNLVSWELYEGQFPSLQRLALKKCWSLKAIPTDFEAIIPLSSIEVKSCSPSVLKSARSINENRQDCYGYDPIAIRHDLIEDRDDDDSLE